MFGSFDSNQIFFENAVNSLPTLSSSYKFSGMSLLLYLLNAHSRSFHLCNNNVFLLELLLELSINLSAFPILPSKMLETSSVHCHVPWSSPYYIVTLQKRHEHFIELLFYIIKISKRDEYLSEYH